MLVACALCLPTSRPRSGSRLVRFGSFGLKDDMRVVLGLPACSVCVQHVTQQPFRGPPRHARLSPAKVHPVREGARCEVLQASNSLHPMQHARRRDRPDRTRHVPRFFRLVVCALCLPPHVGQDAFGVRHFKNQSCGNMNVSTSSTPRNRHGKRRAVMKLMN